MSIFKRGNKYWIDFRYNGFRYRQSSPENTAAGARMYESLLRQKAVKGEPIGITSDEMPVFSEFTSRWMDVYVRTNNKHSEILNKESVLRAHLVPFFGSKKLDKIKTVDIESYKSMKLQSGQSPKSVNNHLIVLNKCFNTAKDWCILENIPKIKLLRVPPQEFDFLDEANCQLLIDNCEGILRNMVLVALKTGLRFGELIALQWTDIDFANSLMTVQRSITRGVIGSPKSNRIRYIPFLDEVKDILLDMRSETGFVFQGDNGQALNSVTCLRWLHKSCKKAGLRKIGWHTLRHTFASHLAQKGFSIIIIKELLGHADIKTTMRYSHLSGQVTREAVRSLYQVGHNMVTVPKNNNENILVSNLRETKIPQKSQ